MSKTKTHTQYRAIIRISLDRDTNSTVRNNVIRKLEDAGFQNTATGAWETPNSSILDIQKHLNDVIEEIAHISADPGHPTVLDHMWFYIDRVIETSASGESSKF